MYWKTDFWNTVANSQKIFIPKKEKYFMCALLGRDLQARETFFKILSKCSISLAQNFKETLHLETQLQAQMHTQNNNKKHACMDHNSHIRLKSLSTPVSSYQQQPAVATVKNDEETFHSKCLPSSAPQLQLV